jgi:hypothetical protein
VNEPAEETSAFVTDAPASPFVLPEGERDRLAEALQLLLASGSINCIDPNRTAWRSWGSLRSSARRAGGRSVALCDDHKDSLGMACRTVRFGQWQDHVSHSAMHSVGGRRRPCGPKNGVVRSFSDGSVSLSVCSSGGVPCEILPGGKFFRPSSPWETASHVTGAN